MSQSLSCTESIKKVICENYSHYKGRARRSEFWYWQLFNLIMNIIFFILAYVISTQISFVLIPIFIIISLKILFPTFTIMVRRLHDTGKSGWFLILFFIPIVGWIILIIMFCQDSDATNEYGPSPKAISTDFMAI